VEKYNYKTVNHIPKVILFNSLCFRFEEKIRNDLNYFEKEILLLSLLINHKGILKNKKDLVSKIDAINQATLDNCYIEERNKYNLISFIFSLEEVEVSFLYENLNRMIEVLSSSISKSKINPLIERINELNKPDVNKIINKLLDYYNIKTITELSSKLNVGQPTISKWKINNSYNAMLKKCKELNIPKEIYQD
jgi:predicted GTPase